MEDEADLTGATPRRRPKPDVLEIGGRRLKPSTLMMGHGYDSALSRRLAQAADLPDLDLRLRERRRRQAPLRGRHRQAAGRRRGPRLFALQRPQPGDTRGPAGRLGGCRGRVELLLGHVGDRHPVPHLRPAGRRRRPFGTALRRHRDVYRPHPRPLRRQVARFPGRRDRGGDRTRSSTRRKATGRVPLIYLESPANPTNAAGRCPGGPPRARRRLPATTRRRSRSTTPSWARSGIIRCAMAPTCRSIR